MDWFEEASVKMSARAADEGKVDTWLALADRGVTFSRRVTASAERTAAREELRRLRTERAGDRE